ncbi:hypothetical protein ScPMuIL_014116 [Solemya velum]
MLSPNPPRSVREGATNRIPSSRRSAKLQRLPLTSSPESEEDTIDYILRNQLLITQTEDEEQMPHNGLRRASDDSITSQYDDNESILDFDVEEWLNRDKLGLIEDTVGDKTYIDECNKTGVIPASFFVRQLKDEKCTLRYYGLGPLGAKAISVPLKSNIRINRLDLEGNWLGSRGCKFLANMFMENVYITVLYLAENKICSPGAIIMSEMLKENDTLTLVDLSGNDIDDKGAAAICNMLLSNRTLKTLYLRYNLFEEPSATCFKEMLLHNECLEELDLSWNRFRARGAVLLAEGVQGNIGLRSLNVSMNGICREGAEAMGQALKMNRSLSYLDVSHNRIPQRGALHIAEGLAVNDTLRTLKISHNPLWKNGPVDLLKALIQNESSALIEIDMENISITSEFEELVEKSESVRVKNVMFKHGGVVRDGKCLESSDVDPLAAFKRDPMTKLKKYVSEAGYRIIDLFKDMDKDGNMSITRDEFLRKIKTAGVELTEEQSDILINRLDQDGDGTIDWREMLEGETEYRRMKRDAKKEHEKFMEDGNRE